MSDMVAAQSGKSEQIGELVAALAKAQAAISAPTKGRTATVKSQRTGATFSYRYADLADVIESYRKPLSENGLSLIQTTEPTGDGGLILATWLLHSSGQWIKSALLIPQGGDDARTLGSWLTYMRRYGACAILGIAAEEDDDGDAAHVKKNGNGHRPDEPILPKAKLDEIMAVAKAQYGGKGITEKRVMAHLNGIARGLKAADILHLSEEHVGAVIDAIQNGSDPE